MPGYSIQYDKNWIEVNRIAIPDCEFCGCCPCVCGKSPDISTAFGLTSKPIFSSSPGYGKYIKNRNAAYKRLTGKDYPKGD